MNGGERAGRRRHMYQVLAGWRADLVTASAAAAVA